MQNTYLKNNIDYKSTIQKTLYKCLKSIFGLLLVVLIASVNSLDALAQCACAGTDLGTINVAGWTVGQSANITTCQYGGERSTIQNTLAGAVYRISTCGAGYDTQLSIYTTGCTFIAYNDNNGPACTGTAASVQFTSPGGNLYSKMNQYNCITNATCTTVSITLISCPSPTLGSVSNAGPINFCDASGNFTTPVTVSGQNGSVVWDWGSNNGVWNLNWIASNSSGVCCFPKKTSNSDGNTDRIRYRVTNCGTSVTSGTILIVNRYNEAPSSLVSSSSSYSCSSIPGTITLTANFPAVINKNGLVAFYSGSCGGTLLGTVTAGDNTSAAALTITAPSTTTNYFVRYEPGTGTNCSNTACASTTVTVSPISNDACANAINIGTSLPYTSAVINNSCAIDDFTTSTCAGPYKNVWWTVTGPACVTTLTAITCTGGTNFDNEMAVFTGSCGSFTEVTCNDDNGAGCTSNYAGVSWASTPGTVYYISVGSYFSGGTTGNLQLNVTGAADVTPPSLDAITVNSNCWIADDRHNYTITCQTSDPSGIGGSTYGTMALVNYQGSNAGNYGGYFAWNTSLALLNAAGYTLDQCEAAGGGFVGKANSFGQSTITLVSGSTSVSGNQRTVNFVVRPNNTFPISTVNAISLYSQDACGNAAGWNNFQLNFSSQTTQTITCPANITSCGSQVVSYSTPTATCNTTVVRNAGLASGSTFPLGVNTVTYNTFYPNGAGGYFNYAPGATNQQIALAACESVYGVGNCNTGSCGNFTYYKATAHLSCDCNKPVGQYEFIYSNTGYTQVGQDYGGNTTNVSGNSLFTRVKTAAGCTSNSWTLAQPALGQGGASCSFNITLTANPTTSNAGSDQNVCATSATLAANTPSIGTGSWSIISGAGGSVTTPTSPTSTFTGVAGTTYTLRWTISNAPCAASTDDVVITLTANPIISTQPTVTQTICVGASTSLTVVATGGTGTFSYQWFSNITNSNSGGTSLGSGSGAQTATYTPPTASAGTVYYYCVLSQTSSGCGPLTSNTATVIVVTDPSSSTPAFTNATICVGGSSNVSVTASNGTGTYTYQWQYFNGSTWNDVVNGTPAGSTYTNATTVTMTIAGISSAASYQYRCNVGATGTGCDVVSSAASTLTVVADPTLSTPTLTNASICIGGSTDISTAASGGTGTFSYQWQYSANGSTGWANVATGTPTPYTYTNATTNTLTIATTNSATAATVYYRCLLTTNTPTGAGCDATSANAVLTLVADPVSPTAATKSPNATSVCEGSTLTISSPTGGSAGLGCVLEYRSTQDGGTTFSAPSTSIPVLTANLGGYDAIQIRYNSCATGCDQPTAWVTIGQWTVIADPAITATTQPPNPICPGGNVTFTVTATGGTDGAGGTVRTQQWQYSADGSTGWANVVDGTPTGITYGVTGTATSLVASTNNATAIPGTYYYRVIVGATGDNCASVTSSALSVTVVADPSPPTATQSPSTTTVCIGASLTLINPVLGSGGAVTQTFEYSTTSASSGFSTTVPTLNPASAGNYSIWIRTNPTGSGCGISTATQYTWTVVADPTISTQPITSQTVCMGSSPTNLTVAATGGTGTFSYQWFSNTTNSNSGGTNLGSGSGAQTATYTPPTSSAGTLYYYCEITQTGTSCNVLTSNTSAVTVADYPVTTGTTICQGSSGTIAATSSCSAGAVTTISGAWNAATDPTANRPVAATNSNTCGFQTSGAVRNYVATPFQVSVTGNYIFEMAADLSYDGEGYIVSADFTPGFCPGSGGTGTWFRNDSDLGPDDEPRMGNAGSGAGVLTLTAGVNYMLVSTTFGSTGSVTAPFTWTITPPSGGGILLGVVQWYTAASGGSPIGTGTPFNPVGVAGSGLANTNTPGTYTYYAACSGSPNCRTAATFVINTAATANAGPDQTVCATSATLAGNAPATGVGTWTVVSGAGTFSNANSPSSTVSGLSLGANTFRWTLPNGVCTDSQDDVIITRDDLSSGGSAPTVTISNIVNATCNTGGSMKANPAGGAAPYTRLWSNGATTGTISNLAAGTYTVTVTSANGCAATASANIINSALAVPTGLTTTNITGTTVTLNWGAVTGAANYTILGRKVGSATWITVSGVTGTFKNIGVIACGQTYEWKVRANCAGGLTSSAYSPTVTFTTSACPSKTDSELVAEWDGGFKTFSLSPNPANNLVTLYYSTETETPLNISIIDVTGRVVAQQNTLATQGDNTINLATNQLPQGYYVVELNDGTTKMHEKLLIVR